MSTMPKIPLDNVRIYPPIGIARVGNSELDDGWFYGPEIPDYFEMPQGGFKDHTGAVKRQAARFRVYAFGKDGQVLGEINKTSGYELVWHIQVMNKKPSWYAFMARTQEGAFKPGFTTLRNPTVQPDLHPDQRTRLIVDSGLQQVSGYNQKPIRLEGDFYGSKDKPTKIYLGEARTDEEGRLVVLAGHGKSKSIAKEDDPYPYILSDFDSPDWIDDTSDGWISVTIKPLASPESSTEVSGKARVIGTVPKFTNGIYAPTSLYDLMEEVYEREKRTNQGDKYDIGQVDWYKHIWPLLRVSSLLSWVNIRADDGHGPNSRGNFFQKEWQDSLSDKNAEDSEAIRKEVLGRMRLPETNSKYDQARSGQAFPYFMPWLSGDGGRTTAGDQSTFTSVTELQYDRLVKWSKGEFTKVPVKQYTRFDDIPLQDQPAALTKAALETTIGAALYPGIEMSWNSQLSETYQLDNPFTINENVKPGDLTKFLSLPWQSDFYMCRSYWWPSARPDMIVTEETYNIVSQSVVKANIARKLSDRVPWERGLHKNYTDRFADQPLFGNTDMAKNWHKLGFIVQRHFGDLGPIFVETQRETIQGERKSTTELFHLPEESSRGDPLLLPTPLILPALDQYADPILRLNSLREHLRVAMRIELATIPVYLFGMYSIKIPDRHVNDPRYHDPIIGAIQGVVAEEMLHLSLAGNILLAIGGKPKIYEYRPSYPMCLPGHVPKLTLHLRRASKANLQTFIDIEVGSKDLSDPNPDQYETIGQFYAAIKKELIYLNDKVHLFDPDTAIYQFSPGLGYQPQSKDAGGSIVVTDLASAIKAIDRIVIQGEGSSGSSDKARQDHYDIFLSLKEGHATWDTYSVIDNPPTSRYWVIDKKIYRVSVTFDAAYCFLLRTIEILWTVDKNNRRHKLVLGNMFGIMIGVLKPLAQFLFSQPIGLDDERAAPCFGCYKFKEGESELKQLQDEMQATINAYLAVTDEAPGQGAVTDYGPMLETLLPIQTMINGLVDLETFDKRDVGPTKKTKLARVESRGAKGFAKGF